jgi:phage terminase large subunit GpA-like protein
MTLKNLERALKSAKEFLRPPPAMKPSEWAEKNIKIPVGNAIAGLIRFDNAPYQREVIDQSVNPNCYRISLMWGAQIGKTQAALCVQAYHIAMKPVPQMMMQPSQGDLQVWLNSKFTPMVEANETLTRVIAKPRGRKGVNNSLMKSYAGGFLMFAWSGSAKTMRGRSAPVIVADEVDGYEVTGEGHPVGLLWQRAATFGENRKLLEISTPTIKGESYIEASFLAGDQRRFYVLCPFCEYAQTLKWDRVWWQGKGTEKDNPDDQYPETAGYRCESCDEEWNDGHRKAAIRDAEKKGGGWKALKPFRGHASYHLSELYSIFVSLKAVVQSYLDKLVTGDLQTFINVSLAETFEQVGETADPDAIYNRREDFKAPVPHGGTYLTAGVDMQPDRLEVEVVAWGLNEESWSVDYHVIWGDPLETETWDDLEEFLGGEYLAEDGSSLRVQATAVDTGGQGGNTQSSYDWLRNKITRKIFGIKGMGGWGRPIASPPSRKQSGKKKRKFDLFLVGVDEAKLIVMRRLNILTVGAGYCHFPLDRNEEYFHQLTAEKLVTKRDTKGFPVKEWHKTRSRNEALDCRVYAYAALKIANPRLKKPKDLEAPIMVEVPPPPLPTPVESPPVETLKKKKHTDPIRKTAKKNWVQNY